MKKFTLLIIIYLIAIVRVYSVSTVVILGTQYALTEDYTHGEYYLDITLTQDIGNLSIYGNYRNEMDFGQWKPLGFLPEQDFYTVGASYDFDFATIRLEHMCMHPVVSRSHWSGLQGGYTRFEVQI
jgi:hypothetical protein